MKLGRTGKMSNKLKDIFSNKKVYFGGDLHFQDNKSREKFLKALQIVQNEGREMEVKGVSSVVTKIRDDKVEYPFIEDEEITKFIIAPSKEDVPIILNTECGKKTVIFKRYRTSNEIILETDKPEVLYFKIKFIRGTSNVKFTYKIQPHLAETVKDIVEKYNTAIAFLNTIFIYEDSPILSDGQELIYNVKKSILRQESFFKRLYLLEQELGLSFQPIQINDTDNDVREVEELYLLLVEKKVIRLNAAEPIEMTIESGIDELKIGMKLGLTFLRELEYTIYGQKIFIHTADLLARAIIKEIKESEGGTVKVLYGDTDDRPMYISYTGFKTIEEAEQERKTIMEQQEKKEKYIDALTFNDHMREQMEKLKFDRGIE